MSFEAVLWASTSEIRGIFYGVCDVKKLGFLKTLRETKRKSYQKSYQFLRILVIADDIKKHTQGLTNSLCSI
jgi:hypothetical protein